jgi:hypothetical protein
MYQPVPTPPSWLGHCPYCHGWVEMNLRKCPHCTKAFSDEQVDAIKRECVKRKRDKRLALYVLLGLIIVAGSYIIIDLQLYKSWF